MKRLHCNILIGLLLLLMPMAALAAGGTGSSKRKTIADLPPAAQVAISEAMGRDDAAYHATKFADGYQMTGAQDLRARFSSDGVVVSGWRLSLAGIGRGDELQTPLSAKPEIKANRVEYRRGDVTEWYVNGPLGLEQGFTLDKSPASGKSGPLILAMNLPKDLQAEIAQNRTDVTIVGQEQSSTGNLLPGTQQARPWSPGLSCPANPQSPTPNPRPHQPCRSGWTTAMPSIR